MRRQAVVMVIAICVLAAVVDGDLPRCSRDRDCPQHSHCERTECSRCVCEAGYYFSPRQLIAACHRPDRKIGDPCDHDNHMSQPCPPGSRCHSDNTCGCPPNLLPHPDGSRCRPPRHGESCSQSAPCATNLGLQCQPINATCGCHVGYRLPTPWASFVVARWQHSQVSEPHSCVIRAVGEPCAGDEECQAVQGSSAYCGECGVCQCRVTGHVTDILGTTCGPPLQFDDACALDDGPVCAGSAGLQCGDMCDLYYYQQRARSCRCSQMHERVGSKCLPKEVGSSCGSDLDCYLVRRGFGYCDRGRCKKNGKAAPAAYEPVTVTSRCMDETIGSGFYEYDLDIDLTEEQPPPPPGGTTGRHDDGRVEDGVQSLTDEEGKGRHGNSGGAGVNGDNTDRHHHDGDNHGGDNYEGEVDVDISFDGAEAHTQEPVRVYVDRGVTDYGGYVAQDDRASEHTAPSSGAALNCCHLPALILVGCYTLYAVLQALPLGGVS